MSDDKTLLPATTVRSQAALVLAMDDLDRAFGVATRAARACGEPKLMQALEARWDDYRAALLEPVLQRQPAQFFE